MLFAQHAPHANDLGEFVPTAKGADAHRHNPVTVFRDFLKRVQP